MFCRLIVEHDRSRSGELICSHPNSENIAGTAHCKWGSKRGDIGMFF